LREKDKILTQRNQELLDLRKQHSELQIEVTNLKIKAHTDAIMAGEKTPGMSRMQNKMQLINREGKVYVPAEYLGGQNQGNHNDSSMFSSDVNSPMKQLLRNDLYQNAGYKSYLGTRNAEDSVHAEALRVENVFDDADCPSPIARNMNNLLSEELRAHRKITENLQVEIVELRSRTGKDAEKKDELEEQLENEVSQNSINVGVATLEFKRVRVLPRKTELKLYFELGV
jgi:hypothetical protein